MKGVAEMKISHSQMMEIIELWLRSELLRGYGAKNYIPIPVSVTQNTITKEFIIKFADATVESKAA